MNDTYAYLDESGSFFRSHGYFVVAILVTSAPRPLQKIIRKAREEMKCTTSKRQRSLSELKFYNASTFTKEKVLTRLGANQEVDIYLLSLEIEEDTPDSPENYAEALWIILQDCLVKHPQLNLIVDYHFNLSEQRTKFNQAINQCAAIPIQIVHKDSQRDNLLQLADFVAGATYQRYRRQEQRYYELFSKRIVVEKNLKWPFKTKKTETPEDVLPVSGGPR